jgi:hypothetical protein
LAFSCLFCPLWPLFGLCYLFWPFWPFLAFFGLFALSTKVMLISLNYRSTQKPLTALSTKVVLASFNYRLTKQPFLQKSCHRPQDIKIIIKTLMALLIFVIYMNNLLLSSFKLVLTNAKCNNTFRMAEL